MKKRKLFLGALGISIALFFTGFIIGMSLPKRDEVSFFALVLENNGVSLLVEGTADNDLAHRSQFHISLADIKKQAILNIDGMKIQPTEILENSIIKITYDGKATLSYPASIKVVRLIRIISLQDKK